MPPIARAGDLHACPRHGPNVIVTGGQLQVDGRPVARVGDTCSCGGVIVLGSTQVQDGGRPIAYVGCMTSCGGVIVTGSSSCEVEP